MTFHRLVLELEILSEEPIPEDIQLAELAELITTGPCSGLITITKQGELCGKEMATALLAQGSDPEFFQLDDDGNDLED